MHQSFIKFVVFLSARICSFIYLCVRDIENTCHNFNLTQTKGNAFHTTKVQQCCTFKVDLKEKCLHIHIWTHLCKHTFIKECDYPWCMPICKLMYRLRFESEDIENVNPHILKHSHICGEVAKYAKLPMILKFSRRRLFRLNKNTRKSESDFFFIFTIMCLCH